MKNIVTDEMEYMRRFIEGNCFDDGVAREQLRALWTAYCIHQNLDVDTDAYDAGVKNLWSWLPDEDSPEWNTFEEFDGFLCKFLV